MATADQYAQWIVDNADKKGTDDFNTVVQAYQEAKSSEAQPQPTQQPAGPVAPSATKTAVEAVAPAVTAYGYGAPTGLGKVAGAIGENVGPALEGVKNAFGTYVKNPLTAAVDYGAMHLGMPPPYATANTGKGLYNTYKGVTESLQRAGQSLAANPEAAQTLKPFIDHLYQTNPNAAMNLSQQMDQVGVQKALEGFKAPAGLSEEALASLNAGRGMLSAAPGMGRMVAGGLLRGAARFAGPVGLAMTAYDAAQYARDSGLGQRLASGQGQLAPQAYRGLLNQNTSGYQVTPEEASNLLASGDERTINIYGGRNALQNIVTGAVRSKAAQKVLGQ